MEEVVTTKWLVTTFLGIILCSAMVSSQNSNDCSFDEAGGEVSTCNLLMDATPFKLVSWRKGTGSTFVWLGGPSADAQQSAAGGFAFASITDMAESPLKPKKAWMITNYSSTTGALGRCLRFAHAMGDLGVKMLEVLLLSYGNEDIDEALSNGSVPLDYEVTSLWRTGQTTNGEWQQVQLTYSTMRMHSLVFSASPDMHYDTYRGYVAVDDITFTDGPCDNECMFDLDFCSWKNNETGDNFDWTISRSSSKAGTGPSRDQASAFDNRIYTGGFAYADSSFPRLPDDKALLVSSVVQSTEKPLCLRFWLNMHGGGAGNVRVLYSSLSAPSQTKELWKLWEGTRWSIDSWYPCQQTIASTEDFQIAFEASIGVPGAGDVGLDTITFTEGPCPSLPPSSNSGWNDCTFMDDTCRWETPVPSNYECTFLSRVSGGKEYNPPGHTESVYQLKDMYMKFDLNCFKNRPRERAALVSSKLNLDTDVCLSFWVFMSTNVASQTRVGALRVVLQYPDKNTTIWRLQNEQQSGWTYAQVKIPATPSVKIAIEGIQGPKAMGMIGVDDIVVFPLDCSLEPASAMVQEANCHFDHDLCLWQVEDASDQGGSSFATKWHLAAGDKIIKDHTFGADGGGFAYVHSLNKNYKSRMKSPTLPQNQTFCLTFSFTEVYMNPSAKISLIRVSEGKEEVLWSVLQEKMENPKVSNKFVGWRFAKVLLESQSNDYELVLESVVTNTAWAVDDVVFIPDREDCSLVPSYAKPL